MLKKVIFIFLLCVNCINAQKTIEIGDILEKQNPKLVKNYIKDLHKSPMKFGEYNAEMYFTSNTTKTKYTLLGVTLTGFRVGYYNRELGHITFHFEGQEQFANIKLFLEKSFKGTKPTLIKEEDSYEEYQWQLDDNFVYKLVNSNLGDYEYSLEIEGDVYRKVNNIINPQKAKN